MYCKNCGKQIADDAYFCRYCGTKVQEPGETTGAAKSTESAAQGADEQYLKRVAEKTQHEGYQNAYGQNSVPGNPGMYAGGYQQNPAQRRPKSKRRWIIPIVIIAGFLVVAAIGASWLGSVSLDGVDIDGTTVTRGDIDEGDDYKDSCKAVEYSEFSSDPSKYAGEKIVYSGEVHVIKKGDDAKTLIVDTQYDDDYDMYTGDTIMVKYSGDAPVYNYARLTIYGEATGETEQYEDSLYGEVTIPVINAKYIEIVEGER